MRSLHHTWALSAFLCLYACEDGTSTGNPNMDGDGPGEISNAGGGTNCKIKSAQEIGVDAETSLGFKASDLLAFVEGKHEEKLRWNPQDGFGYGPESGEHALTIEITRKGAPRLTHYTPVSSNGGEIGLLGGADDCSDAIEIDVQVHVETDQGALDETFDSTLVARNRKSISIYHRLKDDAANGSFATTSVSVPNARVVQLSLGMTLTEFGTQGSFTGILEQRSNGAVSAGASRDPIASWGPQDCGYHGTPVPRSAKIQSYSADDVLALLNRSQSGSVTFDGAQASSATMAFSAHSDHACAVLGDGNATFGGAGSMYVRASLRIRSSDGRIDATWPVGVTANSTADGELAEAQVSFDDDVQQIMGTVSFGDKYGISGLDVSAFDSAIALLSLSASAQQPLSGDLIVNGFKNMPCTTMDTSEPSGEGTSSGCAGATVTQVATARITGT